MATSLPRLPMSAALVDERGFPTQSFQTWWNEFAGNLESVLNSQQDQLTAITALQTQMQDRIDEITAIQSDLSDQLAQILAAQAAADAAQSTADTAQTAADTAQTTANTVNRNDSISTSWTSPGTILSASDTGSAARITISTHTRKYTDVSSKSVTGDTINGLNYSTTYYVYYDQTSRNGGAVNYHATTNPNTALPGAAAGRHYCGVITTPVAGGGSTSGGVDAPSGGGGVQGGQIP